MYFTCIQKLAIPQLHIMEELFAAVKSGSVDKVKRIISETGLPLTVCNEVCI